MPSKEDICVVQETLPPIKRDFLPAEMVPPSKRDFLPAEMEELVAAIKHNLKLKSKPRNTVCRKHRRMSPYSAPVRTVCRRNNSDKENAMEHSTHSCKYCILKSKSPITDSSDDPYEMLQELIREGRLIKEAVKRAQLDSQNKRPKQYKYDFDADSESEIINVEN